MDTSWISSTTSNVFNYLYNQVTGEDESAGTYSSRNALAKGMWVTDLPTNNYEPLEASHGARTMAKKVRVFFSALSFLFYFHCDSSILFNFVSNLLSKLVPD